MSRNIVSGASFLRRHPGKILALIYFHFAAISDTPVNNLTLLYKDFLFLLPPLTNCVSGRYLVRRNLLLREEPFLEGSLIFSSPPQGYPSWEGPLFKLKRTWCIYAIIVLPTTYTSTATVANENCSLCLLCMRTCVHSFVRMKIYRILFSPA